jgi:hypothetical protein
MKKYLLRSFRELCQALEKSSPKCEQLIGIGIGGMWTPDDKKGNDDLVLSTYAGGYERVLISRKFGFRLIEVYTNANGSEVSLSSGTLDAVEAALNFYRE